jgi:hypothetical protein
MNDLLRYFFGFDGEDNNKQRQAAAQPTDSGTYGGIGTPSPDMPHPYASQALWLSGPWIIHYQIPQPSPQQRRLASVMQMLAACPELRGERFTVSLKGNTVILSGPVTTSQNARLAQRMALETPGIKEVINHMSVVENN